MQTVGVRELKDHLTQYLRTVRQGSAVTVTLHGKAVARLVPVAHGRDDSEDLDLAQRLWGLVADGFLDWNGGAIQLPEPVTVNRSERLLSDLVVEGRE